MKTPQKNLPVIAGIVFSTIAFVVPFACFAAGPATVDLSSAGSFAVLAKSGISTTGSTVVVGDIGVSPSAATSITGFGLSLTAASAYSTSPEVSGKVYAPGYADPTPANLTAAVGNMETAYTNAAGRTNPTATELGAGNIGGLTIAPGLYKWGTGVIIPADVTLSGSANDVWIFQIAQTLTVSSSVKVTLAGGAQAANIFWVVAGQTTIGTGALFNGNILDQTGIVLNTGATLNGRALAQTAVTLDANSVTIPGVAATVIIPTPVIVVPPPVIPAPVVTPIVTPVVLPVVLNTTNTTTTTTSNNSSNYTSGSVLAAFGILARMIPTNLVQGDATNDVKTLQQFLMTQNKGSAATALSAAGSTGYFGSLTRASLAEFQASVGISPALGNFGPITRAYLAAHY